jgi:hypothetical protein
VADPVMVAVVGNQAASRWWRGGAAAQCFALPPSLIGRSRREASPVAKSGGYHCGVGTDLAGEDLVEQVWALAFEPSQRRRSGRAGGARTVDIASVLSTVFGRPGGRRFWRSASRILRTQTTVLGGRVRPRMNSARGHHRRRLGASRKTRISRVMAAPDAGASGRAALRT